MSRESQPRKNSAPSPRKIQALRAVDPCRTASASSNAARRFPCRNAEASRSNAPVSSSLIREAPARPPALRSRKSRRIAAMLSSIRSKRQGVNAARPMRRRTLSGRAPPPRSSPRGDMARSLDLGDQSLPVLRNAVDLSRRPIGLPPDERRRALESDLLGDPIVLLQKRGRLLRRGPPKTLMIPRFRHTGRVLAQKRFGRRRALAIRLVVQDRDRNDRELDAAGRHIGLNLVEGAHRVAAIGVEDHPQPRRGRIAKRPERRTLDAE